MSNKSQTGNETQNAESKGDAGGTTGPGKGTQTAKLSFVVSVDSIRFLQVAALAFVTFLLLNTLFLVWFWGSYQERRDAAEASLGRIERHLGTSFCGAGREALADTIYFSEEGYTLDAEPPVRKKRNDEALKRLADRLGRARGTGIVLVIASASPDGDVVANLHLSERRAHEVVKALKGEVEPWGDWFRTRWEFVAVPRGEGYDIPDGPDGRLPAAWRNENRKAWVELCRSPHPPEASEPAVPREGGLPTPLRLGLLLGVFALAATLWWKAARTGEPAFSLLGSLQAGIAFVSCLSWWWWDTPANHFWAELVLGLHTTAAPYPFTVQNAIWIVLFLLVGNFGATIEAGKTGGQWATGLWDRLWSVSPRSHQGDGK